MVCIGLDDFGAVGVRPNWACVDVGRLPRHWGQSKVAAEEALLLLGQDEFDAVWVRTKWARPQHGWDDFGLVKLQCV